MKNAEFSFNPREIDAMILSHAHADHVGRVPVLSKKGFKAKIHCTYATKDLAEIMLQDSGYINEKDEEYFCRFCQIKHSVNWQDDLHTAEVYENEMHHL